jgi:AcrR family transcriptional regulator
MPDRRSPRISSRKQPQQVRSNELVAAILDAAIQVLAKEGAQGFTTARVAEKAGVSVGSLYQYFPNKAAILFRLQANEWRQTTELLRGILEEIRIPPLERLRCLVHAFIRSECDEAAVRVALNDAAPLYRDAPEAQEARASGGRTLQRFIEDMEKLEEADLLSKDALLPEARDAFGDMLGVVGDDGHHDGDEDSDTVTLDLAVS